MQTHAHTQTLAFPATFIAAIAFALTFGFSYDAFAGPCPGALHKGSGNAGYARTFPSAAATGCTAGVPSGAATGCERRTYDSFSPSNHFSAVWPIGTARANDPTGGCSFMCDSGDCRVGNDGLPVELLQFGVE